MTIRSAILKSPSGKCPARRVPLSELTRSPQSQFGTTNFEPLKFSSTRRTSESIDENRLDSALVALNEVSEQLRRQRDSWLEQCQQETVKLAVAIAERLLRKTLSTDPDSVIGLVRSALDWSLDAEHVRVHLHPDDAMLIASSSEKLPRDPKNNLEFIPDESLSRGDCMVETSNGQIDARIETILDRVAEELLS